MGQPGVGGLGHKHTTESKFENQTKWKLKNRRQIKRKMSTHRHRLWQKVHHGGLELWLIGMRLEGTERQTHTHTQTHTSEGQYEGVDTLNHSQTQTGYGEGADE